MISNSCLALCVSTLCESSPSRRGYAHHHVCGQNCETSVCRAVLRVHACGGFHVCALPWAIVTKVSLIALPKTHLKLCTNQLFGKYSRWDSSPQSPPQEGGALSIRPHERCDRTLAHCRMPPPDCISATLCLLMPCTLLLLAAAAGSGWGEPLPRSDWGGAPSKK